MPVNFSAVALPASYERNDAMHFFVWTLLSMACLIAWDALGFDHVLAHAFGGSAGFPLRSNWFLVHVMHEGARRLAWVGVLALVLSIWWPFGILAKIGRRDRLQLVVTTLAALALVTSVKYTSATSCPWDLAEFGGVAHYVSHWAWGAGDGGTGKCFPGGHASAGFAFIGGHFALRNKQRRAARWWLASALGAGLVLGISQQMRGAHFQSHTLWTGWLCWVCAGLIDLAFELLASARARRPISV